MVPQQVLPRLVPQQVRGSCPDLPFISSSSLEAKAMPGDRKALSEQGQGMGQAMPRRDSALGSIPLSIHPG